MAVHTFTNTSDELRQLGAVPVKPGESADIDIYDLTKDDYNEAVAHFSVSPPLPPISAIEREDWGIITPDQNAALDAANSPSSANAVATIADLAGFGQTDTVDGSSGITNIGDDVNADVRPIYGTSANQVAEGDHGHAHGDLSGIGTTDHHSNTNDPNTNEKAAMGAAAAPTGGNAFATIADLIPGIQGDTGVQGVQGDTGVQGDQGDTGVQGIQGDQGDTGVQGVQGDTGVQGVQGDQGDTGVQGVQGDQGDTGVQGVQGDQGDTGVQGVQGDTGVQGVQGVQGDTGVQGDQGDTGVQGIQGDQGDTGVQGDLGDTGIQGITGAGTAAATPYTPAVTVDWSSSNPANIKDALDRIAAAIGPIA